MISCRAPQNYSPFWKTAFLQKKTIYNYFSKVFQGAFCFHTYFRYDPRKKSFSLHFLRDESLRIYALYPYTAYRIFRNTHV